MNSSPSKLATLLLLIVLPSVFAQKPEDLSVEWIYSGGPQSLDGTPSCIWRSDGMLLMEDQDGDGWTLLNPATGEKAPALDVAKALASRAQLPGAKAPPFPFPQTTDPACTKSVYGFGGDLDVLDLKTSTFMRIGEPGVVEKSARFSPDGRHLAFIRNNDLHVADLATGVQRRLTTDGSETIKNGTLSWVYWEEIFGRQDIGYWWSPDSKALAYFRTDESMVSEVVHLDFTPAVPRLHKQRYPKAGAPNPSVRVGLIELDGDPKTTWVTTADQSHEYVVRVKWLPDSRRVSLQTLDRAHQRLDLHFADRATGKSTHILTETDPGWVNVHDDLCFLDDGKHFLWVSERDGYGHLYRYGMDGKLVNQITSGPWSLHSATPVFWLRQAVIGIDEKNDWIYFGSLKDSVVGTHAYRVHFDGKGLERLTHERGVHAARMDPACRFFLDEHSSTNTPPALDLCDSAGKIVATIAAPKTEVARALGLQTPEMFSIKSADGFEMPTWLYKPKDFDPAKKYPLILHVYGGPSSRTVTDAWDNDTCWSQLLLKKGFLVASIDNRSATGASKKDENTIAGQMTGDGELKDILEGVAWFKAQPWIDPSRVGIWGWSNGGMMTLLMMTRSKEFKAGISVAPVTDWRYYDSIWAETVNRTPQMNPEGYANTNLVRRAKNLSGHLMLVHGTYDDNVHIQNTWHFVDELIKARKLFELQIYPMRQHGIADQAARIHLFTTMLDFWTRSL